MLTCDAQNDTYNSSRITVSRATLASNKTTSPSRSNYVPLKNYGIMTWNWLWELEKMPIGIAGRCVLGQEL